MREGRGLVSFALGCMYEWGLMWKHAAHCSCRLSPPKTAPDSHKPSVYCPSRFPNISSCLVIFKPVFYIPAALCNIKKRTMLTGHCPETAMNCSQNVWGRENIWLYLHSSRSHIIVRRHYSEAILPRRQVVEINCLLEPLVTSSDFSGYLFNPNPMLL